MHEGWLVLDHNRRYGIWEPGRAACQTLTLTSGCAVEVWLNREYAKWGMVVREGHLKAE